MEKIIRTLTTIKKKKSSLFWVHLEDMRDMHYCDIIKGNTEGKGGYRKKEISLAEKPVTLVSY